MAEGKGVGSLLKQLNQAADGLRANIGDIDGKIKVKQQERDALTSAPVSKTDFMAYLAADIDRRGEKYAAVLIRHVAGVGAHAKQSTRVPQDFGSLERMKVSSGMAIPYLTGDFSVQNTMITEEAFYWIFRDQLKKRIPDALEGLEREWPENAVPVEQRRVLVDQLDADISALRGQRQELVNELMAAGLSR
jgi:hypothetical protein